ncbi:MAG: hypothetical protein RSF67_02705 [Clostridia bacterium]
MKHINLDSVKEYLGEITVELITNQDLESYDFLNEYLCYNKHFEYDQQTNFYKKGNILATVDGETDNYMMGITFYDFMKNPVVSIGLEGSKVVIIERQY